MCFLTGTQMAALNRNKKNQALDIVIITMGLSAIVRPLIASASIVYITIFELRPGCILRPVLSMIQHWVLMTTLDSASAHVILGSFLILNPKKNCQYWKFHSLYKIWPC